VRNETYLGNLLEISKEQILDKERASAVGWFPWIRKRCGTCCTRPDKAMHRFWHIHPFLALVAEKGKDQRSMTNSPGWANTRWMEAFARRSGLNLN
jgi:hypothetical protein